MCECAEEERKRGTRAPLAHAYGVLRVEVLFSGREKVEHNEFGLDLFAHRSLAHSGNRYNVDRGHTSVNRGDAQHEHGHYHPIG